MLVSPSKIFGTLSQAAKVKAGKRIPICVTHIITERCNLKCDYCYAKPTRQDKEMTTEQVCAMMDEFVSMGTMKWKVGGGECLLRKDIGEIFTHAKNLGLVLNMDTNGTFVKKNLHIFEPVTMVQLSLDGPAEVHDKIRGQGEFAVVIETIKDLATIGKKPIINTVLSDANKEHLKYLSDLSKEYDFFINFQPVVSVHDEADSLKTSPEEIIKLMDDITALKINNPNITVSSAFIKRMKDHCLGKLPRFQREPCYCGYMYALVNPYGELVRCIPKLGKPGVSGLDIGFKKAFEQIDIAAPCDCTFACYFDMTSLYGLNSGYLINGVKNLLHGRHPYY
jgi:MoaA/NifB/PqqE/SkfB family radical SAM enzyme